MYEDKKVKYLDWDDDEVVDAVVVACEKDIGVTIIAEERYRGEPRYLWCSHFKNPPAWKENNWKEGPEDAALYDYFIDCISNDKMIRNDTLDAIVMKYMGAEASGNISSSTCAFSA